VRNPLLVKQADIWPLMGIHAQDTKHAGAWRLHVLASMLDHNEGCDHVLGICKGGSGKVLRRDLEAAALALGVKRSTFYYWLADARQAGILKGEGDYLGLASQAKLSIIFQCNSIDKQKAIIPLKLLFKPGWKALVYQAYKKANHHRVIGYTKTLKPITRGRMRSARTLEDLTGISPRQQRRYNAGTRCQGNIAITTVSGSWERAAEMNAAARDQGKARHYFTFNDSKQKDPTGLKDYRRVIAHTLPMRQTVKDSTAKLGAKGSRGRIAKALNKGFRLALYCNYSTYQARPRQADNSETFVLFAPAYIEKEPKATRRHIDRDDVIVIKPLERFKLRHTSREGVGVWDANYDL
jgi:hypothetical protein